jgi:hypothetical protein
VIAVVDAYGNMEAILDVAIYDPAVGVLVAVSPVADVHAVNIPAVPPVTPAPDELDIHVPFTEKHPDVRLIPLANVDDAVVDVTFSRFVCIPPANVDVAVVVAV